MSFFKALEQAIENKYYIFPQARLSDLVCVRSGTGKYYKYHNKINRKSVDFVIAGKSNLNPLLAIELDDSSHNYQNRIQRDNFVENVLKDTGLPLLRIRCVASYNVQEIKALINKQIVNS